MIIKGNIRTGGKSLGDYLLSEGEFEKNKSKNEFIEVLEANGIDQGDTLQNILEDFEHSAAGTQCENPLFHVQLRTDSGERLSRDQWLETIKRLEKKLELTDHERVIVAHTLSGEEHVHVAWNRINMEKQKAAELHYFKHKCTDLAREIEKEFGLRELASERGKGKLSRDEEQQAHRHGQSPQQIKNVIRESWQQSDNGKSFAVALNDRGMILARGDRRDFVIVGEEGTVFSVARATGSKAANVRTKLHDLDRDHMPSVEEARAMQEARAQGFALANAKDVVSAQETKTGAIETPPSEAAQERRAQEMRERNAATREEIRRAWTSAPRDVIAFMMELNERGLYVAQDQQGYYVAVEPNGFAHRLPDRDMQQAIDGLRREHSGFVIPTVEEQRAEQREERAQQREALDAEYDREQQRRSAHTAATLYNRASMPSMQRDALRHIQDARRQQEVARRQQERERKKQERLISSQTNPPRSGTEKNANPDGERGQVIEGLRSDFNQSLRDMRSENEIKREDKEDRTEQTESQRARAERAAMREEFDLCKQGGNERGDDEGGRERKREQ